MADRSEIREDAERALSGWRDIREAPLGQTVLLWQRAWRAPFPGRRIDDLGRVWLDTPTPEHGGITTFAEMFSYINVPPDGIERESWAKPPTTASHSPHPLKADPSNTGTD